MVPIHEGKVHDVCMIHYLPVESNPQKHTTGHINKYAQRRHSSSLSLVMPLSTHHIIVKISPPKTDTDFSVIIYTGLYRIMTTTT